MQLFNIIPPDEALRPALEHKINRKTKPLGALGRLEALALQIGMVQQTLEPKLVLPQFWVFAADHGIAAESVSAYPQAVTHQMVLNFLSGGAAINAFARLHNIALTVVDAGVIDDFEDVADRHHASFVSAKIAGGTRNFLKEPAMTHIECDEALMLGSRMVADAWAGGTNIVGFGEMGIGNTAAAAAIMSRLLGLPVAECAGRGTGLDDAALTHKIRIITRSLQRNLYAGEPLEVLTEFGGFEIAMLVGAMLAAAEGKILFIVDGFIASVAALVAFKMYPEAQQYAVFSHVGAEHGHRLLLKAMNAEPLLALDLRLGEGTGAALAYPLLQASVAFLNEMASFDAAGVSEKIV